MKNHIVNHIHRPHLVQDNTLHVIGVISNPVRWHSRYRLYRDWEEHVGAHGNVQLYTVEAAFGDRSHEITEAGHPHHHQVRTRQSIWIKECMINLGVRHLLPSNWRYMAWVDCDVAFRDPSWAMETLHQLQHFHVVQPFQNAIDLGPQGNILQTFNSFGYLHQRGVKKQASNKDPVDYSYGHSGFAWACTRTFYEATGGLIDFAILGSGDHHMAWAMVGEVNRTISGNMGQSYARRLREWQLRARRVTHDQVGFVPGRIEHHFHGPKKRRYYRERWKLLLDHQFDPDHDLMYDHQGLIQLVGKPDLDHAIHRYNISRAEDSIDEI